MDISAEIAKVQASIVAVGEDIKTINNKIDAIDDGTASSSSSDPTNSKKKEKLEAKETSLREEKNIL